tara:strand:- start:66270 stop:66710 length:441 start_codon:yes stop_codon:yes gene_type:complete
VPGSLVIQIAQSDEQISECLSVISELRPHIAGHEFLQRIRQQQTQGFQMAFVRDSETNSIVCVAGFRLGLNLAWGKFLYVDDLVTASSARSTGCGKAMIQWLKELARSEGCDQFHLDSGTQRKDAHRFYEREGLTITSYHFATTLQ